MVSPPAVPEQPDILDPGQLSDTDLARMVPALDDALHQAAQDPRPSRDVDELRYHVARLRIALRHRRARRGRDTARRLLHGRP